jgi:glycosyltransferase involved in cell wall biosynthesis
MAARSRPVISVAIATRNYGRYLGRALDSVFRCQNPTSSPIQVVVADDNSVDSTRAVLADYRLRYPENLEVIRIRTPRGLGAAKAVALEHCAGRTVAILDADDEFLPEKLVQGHAALVQGGVDLVTNDFYHQTEEGAIRLRDRTNWCSYFWPPSTWVFRNGVVRFNRHCAGGEDPDWLERRGSSLRHRHLNVPLNIQHLHGNNAHQRFDIHVPGHQAIHRLLGLQHPNDRIAPSGWACRACGDQYLLPTDCCGRRTRPRPLYFYWSAFSRQRLAGPEFSLIMLTRNGLELTRRAVGSFLNRLPPRWRQRVEWVFVDGCSTDGTLDYLRQLAETEPVQVIVTHPEEPFNYSRTCNRGVTAAGGRFVLLLNNDIELLTDDPWEALQAALEDPRVGVVGASASWSPEQRDPEWRADSPFYQHTVRPVTGYFWGMRREVYWELGGMDESFSGYGFDELDFEFRALLAHYLLATARIDIRHYHHQTFGSRFTREQVEAMLAQNRWRFERKHGRPIYQSRERVEPFHTHRPAALSVVVAARDEADRLRETLARAAADPTCQDGRVQLVVVDNGSTDDTSLLIEEYRLRLPRCLSVITLPEPHLPALARQFGRARAIGPEVRLLQAGEWEELAATNAG